MDDLLEEWSRDPEVALAAALAEADHRLLRQLVALRKKKGISQTRLAKHFGITQASVAAFERYDNDPRLSSVRRYAQGLGVLVTHRVVEHAGRGLSTSQVHTLEELSESVDDLAPGEVDELIVAARKLLRVLLQAPVEPQPPADLAGLAQQLASAAPDAPVHSPASSSRQGLQTSASKYVETLEEPREIQSVEDLVLGLHGRR